MNVSNEAVGDRLRIARETAKLTQEQAAAYLNENMPKANFSKAAVSHWETGRNAARRVVLNLLAKRYGVSLNYIITGEEAAYTRMGEAEHDLAIQISESQPHLREWMLIAGEILSRAEGKIPSSLLTKPTEDNWLEFAKALYEASKRS